MNPVDYVLVSVRTIIIDGWEWESILQVPWVLTAITWMILTDAMLTYRRVTVCTFRPGSMAAGVSMCV